MTGDAAAAAAGAVEETSPAAANGEIGKINSTEPARSAGTDDANENREVLKSLIGKNSDYYLEQFDKIDRGEKSFFNWCACLLFWPMLLYRKQYSYFLKRVALGFIPPFIMSVTLLALYFRTEVMLGGFTVFDKILVLLSLVSGLAAIAYGIAMPIACGKGFNKYYKERLQAIVREKNIKSTDHAMIKKLKPSVLPPILYVVASYLIFILLGTVIIFAGIMVLPEKADKLEGFIESEHEILAPTPERGITVPPASEAESVFLPTEETWQPENSQGEKVFLSNTELKSLNIFLSNFIEAYFEEYSAETDDEELILFAFLHNKLNNSARIKDEMLNGEFYEVIDGGHITNTLMRFFSRNLSLYSFDGCIYSNGKFYVPGASGEYYGYFAQVFKVEDKGRGVYGVYFDIYSAEYDYQMDKELYEPADTWNAIIQSRASISDRYGYAEVQRVTLDNKQTYQLVGLHTNQK